MKFLAPGFIAAALALGLVPLVAFAVQQGDVVWADAHVMTVLRFTLLQASLSTLLSIIPAVFVARALARQSFPGRHFILALFAVPLSLPAIVAVFGLTALYGASGVLGGIVNLYGLGGIVLAHVFFNLPLATRLLLHAMVTVPTENHRLAAQLNFSPRAVFQHVDWPAITSTLPHVSALVFLLCAGSFVIVLVLGGATATTLEVAIYQSLRMDFDVSRALTLAIVQIVLSAALVLLAARALTMPVENTRLRLHAERFDGQTPRAKLTDCVIIVCAMLLVLPVLISVLLQGAKHIDVNALFVKALLTSLALACASCLLALPLAWGLAQAQARAARWRGSLSALGLAAFIVPPAVLATGWFLAFRAVDGGAILAFVLIACMNALMALPFALTVLAPALKRHLEETDKLCLQLSIAGYNRLRIIDMAALRSPLTQAAMMSFVLSMGDLAAVTLLGAQGLVTLPNLVQQQMGHYQSQAAGGTALILGLICFAMALAAQRIARWT
jgi:thiamine transport system permease protein